MAIGGVPCLNGEASYLCAVSPSFCMGTPDPEFWIERLDGSIMHPTSAQPTFEGNWWERSVNLAYATSYLAVDSVNLSGNPYDAKAASDYWRLCPCFCL